MEKLIYIAEDDTNIRNLVKAFLKKEGYHVEAFPTGDLLFDAFLKKPSDLVILDIMMPGSNGLIICSKIRERSSVPILMLTAKDSEEDYISGLALGSDDYFTKPFSPTKLTMRVKAMFRRVDMLSNPEEPAQKSDELTFADLTLSKTHISVYSNDTPLTLTKTEFNLLVYLLEQEGKPVSRVDLLNEVWGIDSTVETRATDDTIKRLRKKLNDAQSDVSIDTVYGFGFKIGVKQTNV